MTLTSCTTSQSLLRYLALGDSYTIGEGVASEARWPVQLATSLRADGVMVSDPEIIARTGWTVAELGAGMAAHSLSPPYEVVTLLIGVNDQYRGGDAERYRADLRILLARAVALAGARPDRVVMVSIPDWGATAFGAQDPRGSAAIALAIDAFNRVGREEANRLGVAFVDITPISRAPAQRALLVDDGLHPSAVQYRAWAQAIAPTARAALCED